MLRAPSVPPSVNTVPTWRPGERTTADVLCLSREIVAVYTHFIGRSLLCVCEECPACFAGSLPRWIGLIAAGRADGSRCILEISAENSTRLARQLGPTIENNMAGVILRVNKDGKHEPTKFTLVNEQKRRVTEMSEHLILESYYVQLGLPGCGAKEIFEQGYQGRIRHAAKALLNQALKKVGAA